MGEFRKVLKSLKGDYRVLNDEGVIERLEALFNLHIKYRKRGRLSAWMDARTYVGEFLLDVFELSEGGYLDISGLCCDVGSGGGYPGLVLALLFDGCEFELIDSDTRKVEYLNLAARDLGLGNVVVRCGRVGDIDGLFENVFCKGLGEEFNETLFDILGIGGRLFLFREDRTYCSGNTIFSYKNRFNGRQRYVTIVSK